MALKPIIPTGLYNSSASAVSSVFGRTGAVLATNGDYTVSQVTNAQDKTGVLALAGFSSITGIIPQANGGLGANVSAHTGMPFLNGSGGITGYVLTSAGVNGVADSGKAALFDGSGNLCASAFSANGIFGAANTCAITGNSITFIDGSSNLYTVQCPGGSINLQLPSSSGTVALTSQLSSGTVTSVSFTGGLISVAMATTTPALTVAGTSGGIPYFSSSSTWATSAALAANSLVKGGGAGVAPSTITTGTGVLTALGVNVGSAGAFVTFNGALGTPSSGTLTSCTGLPVSSGISGLGTGVATALAVNVGSAGAFITFNGALGTPSGGTLTNCTGLPAAGVVGTAAILGANTFTALQTITQASANAGIISSTGWSLTGSAANNMLDFAGTSNTSGNWTLLKLAVTDTARGSTSKFLQILGGSGGTTSQFSIDQGGYMFTVNGFRFVGTEDNHGTCFISGSPGNPSVSGGIQIAGGTSMGWNPDANQSNASTADIYLKRDGTRSLGLFGGTSGVSTATLDIYGDGTKKLTLKHDGTNAVISASSGVLDITTQIKFDSGNTTGAGSALLGANSPASTLTTPYTWFTVQSADGSTVYVPCWK